MNKLFNLISFLNKKEKNQLLILLFLLIFCMLLEISSIALALLAFDLFLNPTIFDDNQIISFLFQISEIKEEMLFKKAFAGIVFFIFIFKSFLYLFLVYKQSRFLSFFSAKLTNRLFFNYISQPFLFFSANNSSELKKNLQVEMGFIEAYLLAFLGFIIESAVMFSIILGLLIIEPLAIIFLALIFSIVSASFIYFNKKRTKYYGEKRYEVESVISKIYSEAFGSIKELKISDKEFFFIDFLKSINSTKAVVNTNHSTIAQSSKSVLETTMILSIGLLLILLNFLDYTDYQFISLLGVIGLSSFKVIPSINKLLISFQSIKFFNPSVEKMLVELNLNSHKKANYLDSSFTESISIDNLYYKYPNSKNYLFESLSIKIFKGDIICVTGMSGSGKSTFLNIISGLIEPNTSQIIIDEKITAPSFSSIRNLFSYVSQDTYLIDDTILRNVAFGIPDREINIGKAIDCLKKAQLFEYISKLENGLQTNVGERGNLFSGGQVKRIAIARALYNNKKILLLDEATSSLDKETQSSFYSVISSLKDYLTIIIVTHDLSEIDFYSVHYELSNNKLQLVDKN